MNVFRESGEATSPKLELELEENEDNSSPSNEGSDTNRIIPYLIAGGIAVGIVIIVILLSIILICRYFTNLTYLKNSMCKKKTN